MSQHRLFWICALAANLAGCASIPTQTPATASTIVAPVPESATPASDIPPAWSAIQRPEDEREAIKPLEALNKRFQQAYADARDARQNKLGTVVHLRGSTAVLFRNGVPVDSARVIPSTYHNLRYASHLPFGVYLRFKPTCGEPWDSAAGQWSKTLRWDMDSAKPALELLGLSVSQVQRQQRMFDLTDATLSRADSNGMMTCAALDRFAREVSLDLAQNMHEAGVAQVDGLHQQLLVWRQLLTDTEWHSLRFIIRGGQQQRAGSPAVIYLSALLQDQGDGRGYWGEHDRVVYREDTSLMKADPNRPWMADLNLMASIDLDEEASEALFGDPDRLAVDVVAQGARARVRSIDFSPLR